jgi:hypothetical protein
MDCSSDLPALKENRPECVWRDAKHCVRDARAPLNSLCSIRSTENIEEPRIFTFSVGQSCRSALNFWAAQQRRPTNENVFGFDFGVHLPDDDGRG